MDHTILTNNFNNISPSAKLTAYWRSFSDIPYAKEISETINAEETAKKLMGKRPEILLNCSPVFFEIRYKAINYGLDKCGIMNVMELACGLSSRGLEVINNDGIYVGTDLQDMVAQSSPIIFAIANKMGEKQCKNLYMQQANVLDKKALEDAASHFRGKTFAVCNEGLLPYLSMEEKAVMAQNIRSILKNNGGCWITTDIAYKEICEKMFTMVGPEAQKVMPDFSERIGSRMEFIDKVTARRFYNDLGFKIEEFPIYADDYILSTSSYIPEDLKEMFINTVKSIMAWKLTAKA